MSLVNGEIEKGPDADADVPRECRNGRETEGPCRAVVVGRTRRGAKRVFCCRACYMDVARRKRETVKPCANERCDRTIRWSESWSRERFELAKYHSLSCARTAKSSGEVVTKPCGNPTCDVEMVSSDFDSWRNFERRVTCSVSCMNQMRGRKNERIRIEQSKKTCANPTCKSEFGIRDGELVANYKKRKYCSIECLRNLGTDLDRAEDILEKTCLLPGCGKKYSRPKNMGREPFKKQKYCSRDCADKAKFGRISGGGIASGGSRGGSRVVSYKKKRPVEPGYDKQGRKLSVFGDPEPTEVWKPGSWRK